MMLNGTEKYMIRAMFGRRRAVLNGAFESYAMFAMLRAWCWEQDDPKVAACEFILHWQLMMRRWFSGELDQYRQFRSSIFGRLIGWMLKSPEQIAAKFELQLRETARTIEDILTAEEEEEATC